MSVCKTCVFDGCATDSIFCNECLWNAHDNGSYSGYEPSAKFCAAGHWRTDEPPRDGTQVLGCFHDGKGGHGYAVIYHDGIGWSDCFSDLTGYYGMVDFIAWAEINPCEVAP